MNTEQLIEIARECGAAIDVLCMGRHDNVVFTSGEIQRFVQRIEQPHIDTIEDLHDEIKQLREALLDIKLARERGFSIYYVEGYASKALEQTK